MESAGWGVGGEVQAGEGAMWRSPRLRCAERGRDTGVLL
jgi:hypothetical protein